MRLANIYEDWQSKAAILLFEDWAQSLIVPMDYIDATATLNGWIESEATAVEFIIDVQIELGETPSEWMTAMEENYRKFCTANVPPGDFVLQRCKGFPNKWLCVYTPLSIAMRWTERAFNATQDFIPLEDINIEDPEKLAGIMSSMGDWLVENCEWLLYPLQMSRSLLGVTCKNLRIARGITIRQLAELAGVNKATIVNIEAGKFSPTIDVAGKVITALGAELRVT